MLTRDIYIAILSVHPSVRRSVCHAPVFYHHHHHQSELVGDVAVPVSVRQAVLF